MSYNFGVTAYSYSSEALPTSNSEATILLPVSSRYFLSSYSEGFPPAVILRYLQSRRASVTDFPPSMSQCPSLRSNSSGVPLFSKCNCWRGRRETSSPVSVASSVHSEVSLRASSVTGFRPRSTSILLLTDSTGGIPHHRIRCL